MFTKILTFLGQNIITKLLADTVLALLRRIDWGDILARLAMRMVKAGLRRLVASTKNTVDDELAEDIIKSLEGRNAPKV